MNLIKTLVASAALVVSSSAFSLSAPYDWRSGGSNVYQSALKKAKITSPGTSTVWQGTGFKGKKNRNFFYIPDSGDRWMTIKINGKNKDRTELRRLGEFSKYSGKTMKGTLKLTGKPSGEVTVLQVHFSGKGAPPLRIARIGNRFKAKFRTDGCKKGCKVNYETVDLGNISGSKYFEIKVDGGKIFVKFGGKSASFDLKKWDKNGYYFKAGAYLQSRGTAEVRFQRLYW